MNEPQKLPSPNLDELENFYENLKKYDLSFRIFETKTPKVDKNELNAFFQELDTIIKKDNLSLTPKNEFNIWRAAGVKHLEVQNCHVLAAIFHPDINEGFGRELLAVICDKYGKRNISELLRRGVPYKVTTEYSFENQDGDYRVDLDVVGDSFRIFFEVKINHTEHETQILSYLGELKNYLKNQKLASSNGLLLFLNKNGDNSIYAKDEDLLKSLSWNYLLSLINLVIANNLFSKSKFNYLIGDYIDNCNRYF